jgi:hypothetical protein
MPLFQASVRHNRTHDDARARLEMAVQEVRNRFGPVIQRVDWSQDRNAVTVGGTGFTIDMRVDAEDVHVSGDILGLAALFGKPLESGVKQIVQQTFSKR